MSDAFPRVFINVIVKMGADVSIPFRSVFLLAALLSACAGRMEALTSHYVAALGDDVNTGTSPAHPWRTITRVNSARLAAGDIVYFRAGDTFEGMITATVGGVRYDAYGAGPKPIITGAVKVGPWKIDHGSVYVTRVNKEVKNLFSNGEQMTLARYPNSGFLTVDETDGKTELGSSGLTQPSGFWNGAQIRIRSTNYTFETRPVQSYEKGRLTLVPHANDYPKNFSYGITKSYGFYLDNALSALDAPGEWYYDKHAQALYFYAPRGVNPNSLRVEASIYPYGFASAKSSLQIRNLEFRHQAVSAIGFEGTTKGNRIESVSITGVMMHGIEIRGASSSYLIDRVVIDRVNGRGILLEEAVNSVISNCRLTRIGLVPGIGIDNENGMTGIVMLAGTGTVIRDNRIDSVGYIGIRSDGSHHRVERNTISNVMLKLSDGGALYAHGENMKTFGTLWKDNTIINAVGNIEGCVSPQPEAHGLYWDFKCHDMAAEGNMVEQTTSSGLFMQYGCSGNTIRNNTFYACGESPIHIYTDTKYPYGGHTIKGNVLYAAADTRLASMYLQFADAAFHALGELDSNYYSPGPGNPAVRRVYKDGVWKSQNYSLQQWQALSGQDRHSREIDKQSPMFFARIKRH